MKTPEEIKKWLEGCCAQLGARDSAPAARQGPKVTVHQWIRNRKEAPLAGQIDMWEDAEE